jgi:hypothetical protein
MVTRNDAEALLTAVRSVSADAQVGIVVLDAGTTEEQSAVLGHLAFGPHPAA